MILRGGSSKGIYFKASDLPADPAERDQVLLDIVGRDARQVDGLGGANPLTSKVGIVSLSERDDSDVDYLFVQVMVGENRVDTLPNCGNILAGIGAFALESGLLPTTSEQTSVRVYMVNSGNRCTLTMQTPKGRVEYAGNNSIDGVPGTAAPVTCHYQDTSGSACGSLLPTGRGTDVINGVPVTCIDNGMPVVLIAAEALGITGYESCASFSADTDFCERLEAIRLAAGPLMNLDDVRNAVVPKMVLLSAPRRGGCVNTRSFIPHDCHAAIGVLAAVSVATACLLPGSVAEGFAKVPEGKTKLLSIEHPSGEVSVELHVDDKNQVSRAGVLRTTRLISRGEAYIHD